MPGAGRGSAAALGVRGTEFGAHAFEAGDDAVRAKDANRLRLPEEDDGVLLGELIFVRQRRASPIRRGDRSDRSISAPRRRAAVTTSMAVLPAPMQAMRRPTSTLWNGWILVCSMNSMAPQTPCKSSPGSVRSHVSPRPTPMKMASNCLFEFGEGDIAADFGVLAEFNAEAASRDRFREWRLRAHFVGRDAVGVQAAGILLAIENGDVVAPLGEFGGAGERSRAGADAGDALAIRQAADERGEIVRERVIDGVALQAADFDGFLALFEHHAGAFAKHFGGADAAAAVAQNVGGKNDAGGAGQIAGRNFLDEGGNVDVRRTSSRAGRVETVEAARGFDGGLAEAKAPAQCPRNSSRTGRRSFGAISRRGI